MAPDQSSVQSEELKRQLLWLILIRAALLLPSLNLADTLGILPERLAGISLLPLLNLATAIMTSVYLLLWRIDRHWRMQLWLQVALDLILTTVLVVITHGVESPFISFYILIVTLCSLTLGRNGGLMGAAWSTILYAGVISMGRLEAPAADGEFIQSSLVTFRIAGHACGFFCVAFLGSHLSRRAWAAERELEEKTDSLRRLQRLNEHIVSSIRSGLITTDLQGQVASFNRAAEEITGKESSQVIDRPVQAILGASLWSKILRGDLMSDARALRHEDWITLPDGTRRFLGFSVSPLLDQSHQLLGYIVSFQDLTEIKRLEEEVRRKDRMAGIGRMAAAIAHEIRNPLTAMQGSVEVLRSHAHLPQSDDRLLDILTRESDRLNRFVADFLTFARPSRSKPCSIDLMPLIRDCATLLKNSPEVRGKYVIDLVLESREIRVCGDPGQLQQVFWNLSQNAVRAMPVGGVLTISAAQAESGVEVKFRDTGVGMTPEEKQQLFQPFHSGFGGGTGLGLSIVFQIMEDHGGSISIESEKGRGTEVTLAFPPESSAVARSDRPEEEAMITDSASDAPFHQVPGSRAHHSAVLE